jgi:hypothetical protein
MTSSRAATLIICVGRRSAALLRRVRCVTAIVDFLFVRVPSSSRFAIVDCVFKTSSVVLECFVGVLGSRVRLACDLVPPSLNATALGY